MFTNKRSQSGVYDDEGEHHSSKKDRVCMYESNNVRYVEYQYNGSVS